MSDTFAVTATYDRNPPNYNAGETIRITISGTNTHTTDPTTTSSPINGFQISVEAVPSGVQTTIAAPSGGMVSTTTPGTSTTEQVFINAAAGAVLSLGGRSWTVSADRKSLTAVA